MGNTLASILLGKIFDKTMETLLKPSTPVSEASAPEVAYKVTEAVKPIVENATNSEPWYKSRIYLGLLISGVGIFGSRFGINIPGSEIDSIVTIVLQVMEVGGLLFATYGRLVGTSKPPIGG